VLGGQTGQDGPETIFTEVHAVFRKKTRGQVIGAELQEGFSHLGTAVTEAGRAVAEELAPRVEAAQKAAGPRIEAAQKAVTPKMAAAVAAAGPAIATARDTVAPRVEAARDAVGPRLDAAIEALEPRVEAARAAAVRAAADLAPRVEAARESLENDVVPKLVATQAAAVAYATPKVLAAREAVATLAESALAELDAVRADLGATTAEARARTKKRTAEQKRRTAKRKGKAAKKSVKKVKGGSDASGSPRWPWVLAVLAVGGVVFAVLRRLRGSNDAWTPAPAGSGPVPSYREDPVPSSPSDSGKTVSTAQTMPGDGTPPDTDLGEQPQQMAYGDAENADTPEPASSTTNDPALGTATAAPDGQPQVAPDATGTEGTGQPQNPA
jgi:hypothetical protein